MRSHSKVRLERNLKHFTIDCYPLQEKPYSCSICGKVFSQPYSVKVHMAKFHK